MTREEYIKLLRNFFAEHGEEYGISRIGIFGSVARDENVADSDVDVLVEASVLGFVALASIKLSLEKLFHTNVDVVRKTEYMPSVFKANIEKDLIYA